MAVKEGFRRREDYHVGTSLLETFEQYYDEGGENGEEVVSVSSVIHHQNMPVMRLLHQRNYLFVDYYENRENGSLWFRVVKLLKLPPFFKALTPTLLPQIFRTVIPIQLNLATQNINAMIRRMNPNQQPDRRSRIVWSSFFQDGFPILSEGFGMPNTFNGYYETLLNCPEEHFADTLEVLKEIIQYQKDKDQALVEEVASLSSIMKENDNGGFELFILSDRVGEHDFSNFPSPVIFDIHDLQLDHLVEKKEFVLGRPGNRRKEMVKLKNLVNGLQQGTTEPEEWLEWCAERRITPEERAFLEKTAGKPLRKLKDPELPAKKRTLNAIMKRRWKLKMGNQKKPDPGFFQKEYGLWEQLTADLRQDPATNRAWEEWCREGEVSVEERAVLESLIGRSLKLEWDPKVQQDRDHLLALLGRPRLPKATRQKWEQWIYLHRRAYEADRRAMLPGQVWVHAVIPMSFSSGGMTGIMFSFIVDFTDQEEDRSNIVNDLAYTISNAFAKNMFNIIIKLQDIISRRDLMKSAISTIMARNMAHNLGSHVLARIASPEALSEFIKMDAEQLGQPAIADLNIYLRTRMDLVADISTSEPVTSMNRRIATDLPQIFKRGSLVRRLISGTNVKNIDLRIINKTGVEPLLVQIPQGDLGMHALLIILENIIRNSCKHGAHRIEGDTLVLTLIFDSPSQESVKEEGRSRGYILTIHDDVPRHQYKELVRKIQDNYIDKSIIEDRHRLRPVAWGIAEMKIAAAYLRKKDPAEYINQEIRPQLLRAVAIPDRVYRPDETNRKAYIGYQIYLKKPREVLIIDTENYLLGNHHTPLDWINRGIKVVSSREVNPNKDTATNSHGIVVLLDDIPRREIERQKNLPLRWMYFQTDPLRSRLKGMLEKDLDGAVLFLWQQWLEGYLERKGLPGDLEVVFRQDEPGQDERIRNTPPEKLVLYDYHGSCLDPLIFPNDSPVSDPARLLYYEAGFRPPRMLFESLPQLPDYAIDRIMLEFLEAACTRILLLDERIQWEAFHRDSRIRNCPAKLWEELAWMNVILPDPEEIDLYRDHFGEEESATIYGWIEDQLLKGPKVDFVVIHLGIIEKLEGTLPDDLTTFCRGRIQAFDPRPEIVLISGRGKPHFVPKDILFLNYSNVAKFLLEEKSKYHLCQLLFSARTRLARHEEPSDHSVYPF